MDSSVKACRFSAACQACTEVIVVYTLCYSGPTLWHPRKTWCTYYSCDFVNQASSAVTQQYLGNSWTRPALGTGYWAYREKDVYVIYFPYFPDSCHWLVSLCRFVGSSIKINMLIVFFHASEYCSTGTEGNPQIHAQPSMWVEWLTLVLSMLYMCVYIPVSWRDDALV